MLQLQSFGFKEGDRVGIYASSSWRWEVAQLAILMGCGVVVGIDPNETESNLPRINALVGLKFVFCEQLFLYEKLKQNILSAYPNVIVIDLSEKGRLCINKKINFTTEHRKNNELFHFSKQDDLAIIVFTSGTTSEPKAIAYSHKKILFAIENLSKHIQDNLNEPKVFVGYRSLIFFRE